ncbi:MAG: hypothetical protein GY796_00595 [Chloroflexi bacterium]|nr:hypothetical protein [Chloroflexota bacterium]
MMKYVGFFLLLFLISCTTETANEEPLQVNITPKSEGDRVEMEVDGETTVFNIYSQTGIGSADIERITGSWPPTIISRFHLNGLEEMRLVVGDTAVTLNLSSSGGRSSQTLTQNGVTSTITPDNPYWMDVTISNADGSPGTVPLKEGTIDVSLPPALFDKSPDSFSLNWIDFYR